jgi:hypothetical protein
MASVGSAPSLNIPGKYMNNAMLDFFRCSRQVHIFTAACWALNLQLITIELMEAL